MPNHTFKLVAYVLIGAMLTFACGAVTTAATVPAPAAATAVPPTAANTLAPTAEPTETMAPEPTPTEDPCMNWSEVTPDMNGQTICVRGIVQKLVQTRNVGARYQFSDKSNTFFLYGTYYEVTNPNTGETLGAGSCLEVTGKVHLQGGAPYINLDELIKGDSFEGFYFYDDTEPCQT